MRCLILLACLALSQAALTSKPADQEIRMTPEEKEKLMAELMDKDLEKEIEQIIDTLDAEELATLENILLKPLDEESELSMIAAELEELGMDPQDVEDLFDLAEMMHKFLIKIPDVDGKLELDSDDYSLEDHCKLYLLGLPNKLGPLGFLALHSILESAGDAVVDVQLGEFEPDSDAAEAAQEAAEASLEPLGDLFSRKRRELEQRAEAARVASESGAAREGKSAQPKEDIVDEILRRRRRALSDGL